MAAATGAQRMDFLNPWTDCRDLDASLATTVKYAMGLFDEGKALPERIAFLGSNSLAKMAMHWDPKGVMGVAGLLFQEAPNLTGISHEVFLTAAGAINEATLHEHIKNLVVRSAISLCYELGGLNFRRMLLHALRYRLHFMWPESWGVPDARLITSLSQADLETAA